MYDHLLIDKEMKMEIQNYIFVLDEDHPKKTQQFF
jgi:hypothetical protein